MVISNDKRDISRYKRSLTMAKQKKTIKNDKITNISINNQIGNEAEEDLKKKHPIKYIFAISTGVLISITAIIPFIMFVANQEVVTRDSYVLLKDLEKEYISIDSYNELKEKIEIYENSHFEKDTKINELQKQLDEQQEWQKRYDALVNERNGFEIQLNNMINFSTGLIGYSEEKNEPKREELLRKIKVRDEQINLILEKIN